MTATKRFRLSAFGDEIGPDLGEQIDVFRELGIARYDLRAAYGKNVLDLSDDEVDRFAATVAEAGLTVQAIGSPVNKLPFAQTTAEAEFAKLRRIIEIAARLGVQRIRIFTPETGHSDATFAADVEAWIGAQVDLAAQKDVILLHENDGRFYGAFPDNARSLLDKFGGPHFRAIYDPGNAALIGLRLDDWFPWLLPHLDTIHVKDGLEATGQFASAGQGDGEFPRLFQMLVEVDWEGTLTMEPHAGSAIPNNTLGAHPFALAVQATRTVLASVGAEA